jgi:hypothetical protein
VSDDPHAAALRAAALHAHEYGAPEIASMLFRALVERFPLSDEALDAVRYLRHGRNVAPSEDPLAGPD